MSNEELCKEIQSGKTERIEDLWEQTHRFIRGQARRRTPKPAADFDDFMQAGYLALVSAAESYDPEQESKFTTWLSYHLLKAFNEASGRSSERRANDPIHSAISLDAPIQDDEDTTRLDLLGDPRDTIEEMEGKIYREQLREQIERVMTTIDGAEILRLRYFEQQPVSQIAEDTAMPESEIRRKESNALRAFRRSVQQKQGRELKRFLEETTDYFRPVGVASFVREHESAVEKAVFQRARLTRDYYRNKGGELRE